MSIHLTIKNENRLSLHMGKTELILFGTKRKLSMHNEFSIVMNDGHVIKSKKSVVGLELNRHLDVEESF